MRSPFIWVRVGAPRMAIAAAFLFFCSTGLYFGGALRRHPAITALVGLTSIAVAIAVYRQSSTTVGPARGAQEFLVPYLYFVSSAAVLGRGFWKRPRVAAAAACLALAFAVLAYPQMYGTIDWLHHKSTGVLYHFAQAVFHRAESALAWMSAGSGNQPPSIDAAAVQHTVVALTMLLFFVVSGLASRLFTLVAQTRSPAVVSPA